MTITKVEPVKGKSGRCNLYADGEFICSLALETAVKYRLKAGAEILRDELLAAVSESESRLAFDRAAAYLSRGQRTEQELKKYLMSKGFAEEACESAAKKLKGYGILDDGAYAENLTESRKSGSGARKVRFELRRKGVPEDDIERALEKLDGGVQESAARTIAEKYMRGKERNLKSKQGLYRRLASRGFGSDICMRVLSEVFDGEGGYD